MDEQELTVVFEGASPGDAAILAQDLEQQLHEDVPTAKIRHEKSRADSQDFGSTLVLLFGTPVAITLARAVISFLQRNSGASITITSAGTIVAKNLDSTDAAKIAEAFAGKTR
jgi:hypothetical protein